MKKYLLFVILATVLLPMAAFAEEHEEVEPERQMELRNMQMELEEREMEMDFRRKMQEMELKKHGLEMKRAYEGKKHHADSKRHQDKGGAAILLFCAIVNILLTVWVYQDIRKKTDSSGIWIVVVLLTGLLGALVYAVVRIGDLRKAQA
jgi:hypothetical protein